jgi:hypothetical protein
MSLLPGRGLAIRVTARRVAQTIATRPRNVNHFKAPPTGPQPETPTATEMKPNGKDAHGKG